MVRFSKIIYCLLIFFIGFQAQAKNPPPGTGTADIPANILIMLDNSGSMSTALYSSVQIYYPLDVDVDSSGNVYALEYHNNRIKVFDSSGAYLRSIGGYGTGCNRWKYARQFDIYDDKIYIADTYGHKIKILSLTGGCVRSVSSRYYYPHAIAVAPSYVYVGHNSSYISMYSTNTLMSTNSFNAGSNLSYSWGMSVNVTENIVNKLVIADYVKNRIVEFTMTSGYNLVYNQAGNTSYSSSTGYFRRPMDAAYDSSGNIYALDLYNHRIQKFNSSLTYQATAGSYSTSTSFRYPYGMAIDSSDNIFVTDYYNFAVRKYDTSLTLAETYGGGGGTRLDAAKKVIKKIVSNTDLTAGANFGLMEWGSNNNTRTKIRVNISATGAKTIYSNVDGIYASGGTYLHAALIKARNYFTGGNVANWNKSCSINYLIVISDGAWSCCTNTVNSTANQLKNMNIKTFAVGFALGGSSTNYKNLATNGGTTTPLYADNESELLAKLTDAIKQAISGRLTFTTPAVMSDITKGNYIYQSTFEYEKNKQWKGHLKKYKLNANGSFGAAQWDAADKLNSKDASSRSIWTTGISTISTNNFTTSYSDDLKSLLFPSAAPTDTEVDNLINFIRGVDTYDQDDDSNTTESIHKLADIYHSELIVVGPPEGSITDDGSSNFEKKDAYYRSQNKYNNFKNGSSCGGSCANRKEIILAGANNGILHAFDTSDGDELWGYIPPNILGKLERIPSSQANVTNAIYGIDGSPIVKDIYYDDTPDDSTDNPVWKTIVLTGLGAGGHGYFAIDITDVNSPTHLFAIENDPFEQVVRHWDSDGLKSEFGYASGNILANMDYRKLGEAWSTPRIIRIKVSGKDKWVAVFGGGYNGGVNHNTGSAVFVMDLEDEGRLLEIGKDNNGDAVYRIDITDNDPSQVTQIYTGNGNQTKFNIPFSYNSSHTLSVYLSKKDTSRNIWNSYVDATGYSINGPTITFTDAPENNDKIKIIRSDITNIVNAIPSDLSVITADGTEKANYNGALVYAADLEGKITKINLTDQGTLYQTTTLFDAQSNTSNGRYIYKKAEATINNDNNLWLYFGTGNTQKLQNQSSNILNRVYGIKDKDFPNFATISSTGTISQCKTAPTCPGGSDLGWYLDLKKAQKVTAEPTIDKDRVYFPIYEPTSTANACKTGAAILTAYDTKCGNSVLNVNLGTGVLSKVVVQGDNLYIGIAGEVKKNIAGFTSTGNLITGKSKAKGSGGKVQLEGWKENY